MTNGGRMFSPMKTSLCHRWSFLSWSKTTDRPRKLSRSRNRSGVIWLCRHYTSNPPPPPTDPELICHHQTRCVIAQSGRIGSPPNTSFALRNMENSRDGQQQRTSYTDFSHQVPALHSSM